MRPTGKDDDAAGQTEAGAGTRMERKATNDAIAYLRALAELRGRDVAFAEAAVRDAATRSANHAAGTSSTSSRAISTAAAAARRTQGARASATRLGLAGGWWPYAPDGASCSRDHRTHRGLPVAAHRPVRTDDRGLQPGALPGVIGGSACCSRCSPAGAAGELRRRGADRARRRVDGRGFAMPASVRWASAALRAGRGLADHVRRSRPVRRAGQLILGIAASARPSWAWSWLRARARARWSPVEELVGQAPSRSPISTATARCASAAKSGRPNGWPVRRGQPVRVALEGLVLTVAPI